MNRTALEEIFGAALRRVDPVRMMTECVRLEGDTLIVTAGDREERLDLTRFDQIQVVGAGKAGARMAAGLEQVLGVRIGGGLVSVKYGHTEQLDRIELIEAGHPVPDEQSVTAARSIAQIADRADERTLVIVLISGGGSALLTLPYEDNQRTLTLDEIQATTQLLLECGAPIQEINTVRKHLSGISGGRFCARLRPATSLSLILSDVVGDSLENIASGLTSPDPATFADALAIAERYGITERLPEQVRSLLTDGAAGRVTDTPGPDDPSFERVRSVLIGTNALALEAARERAVELGYNTVCLSSQITGEASEIARFYGGIAREAVRGPMLAQKPCCILAGGETTVTIRGTGTGGRNQELALAFLREIEDAPEAFAGVSFLSGATDGNDGPTDAAGAFASREVLERARRAGLSIRETLAHNDSYHFFERTGDLLKTGPTNTNVCDVQVVL
ncbi:MAG: glycerate kinase type-2 family protein, partial [bacterium]